MRCPDHMLMLLPAVPAHEPGTVRCHLQGVIVPSHEPASHSGLPAAAPGSVALREVHPSFLPPVELLSRAMYCCFTRFGAMCNKESNSGTSTEHGPQKSRLLGCSSGRWKLWPFHDSEEHMFKNSCQVAMMCDNKKIFRYSRPPKVNFHM